MTEPSSFRSPEFWIAIAIALIVKIKTTAQLGPLKVITTIAVAVGAAWVGADWAAETLGVPVPVAGAVVTLTAEGVMRWLLLAVDDLKNAIDLWKHWRR
ncbi:hypothetical protein [Paracoccus aminophilus]|uniref:Uncharacterized protein n=1 Tax=Paracoccus aminophilus JCM 7686 TaxID=1367847 RepID=S5YAA6_PARAH|nr:hypothetical protein [Paracoccus aminophilus]AGT08358.1 hypothetical protein JCM7686_1256 [Paracoccus aminophilus JCM 7686]